jgi:hypothetical protein
LDSNIFGKTNKNKIGFVNISKYPMRAIELLVLLIYIDNSSLKEVGTNFVGSPSFYFKAKRQ